MSIAPYFLVAQKQKAIVLADDYHPNQKIAFSSWRVLRSWWFVITCPQFLHVDRNVIRHYETAISMMINHADKNMNNNEKNAGGVKVDVEWSGDNNLAMLRVFPKTDKYIIIIERDAEGNVSITTPYMTFKDLPSASQLRHVLGQVVEVVTSMGRN